MDVLLWVFLIFSHASRMVLGMGCFSVCWLLIHHFGRDLNIQMTNTLIYDQTLLNDNDILVSFTCAVFSTFWPPNTLTQDGEHGCHHIIAF